MYRETSALYLKKSNNDFLSKIFELRYGLFNSNLVSPKIELIYIEYGEC